MSANNIPAGLKVPKQVPLDAKTYVASQAVLADLGFSNNLAYTYYDGLRVFCVAERSTYEWREVKPGEENVGLVLTDFTYPTGLVILDIDYSNKKYNFFKIENIQGGIQNIGVSSENIYKGLNLTNNRHEFKGVKDSLSIEVSSNSTDVSLEIKEIAENVGTEGITVYKEFDFLTKKHRFKKIRTTNLVMTEVDGSINIDSPVNESNLSFFVDQGYTGTTQKGTLAQPFKTLNKAITAFIGSGDWMNPEFEGYKITLLSSVELYGTSGVDYVGMNNLDVNTLNIVGNGNYLTLQANPSVDYYPISSRRMVTNMLGANFNTQVLPRGIYMKFKDLTLQRTGTSAIVDNLNYSYPKVTAISAISPFQPIVDLDFENIIFTNDSTLSLSGLEWQTVPDPNNGGADTTFFGETIYVSDNVAVPLAPMLKTEGYGWNREGYLSIKDIIMVNSLGTYIYAKETSFSFGKISFGRNQTRILYDAFNSGIYTPKTGQYYIELKDCNFTQFSTLGPQTIPSVAVSLGGDKEYIGGSDAWLKMTNSHCLIHEANIEGGFNNIINSNGLVNVNINNMLTPGSKSREAHGFHRIVTPLPTTSLSDNISNSNIVDVKVNAGDLSYLGEVRGLNNNINYYKHNNSGVPTYANNGDAIAAGLFKGMEYSTPGGVINRVY
jgi:hypothetical protein